MNNIYDMQGVKKVLLVGGAGFIGHNLALELRRMGVDVDIADAFKVNNLVNLAIFI